MFFLIHGEDTYRSRRKLSALRERFSAARDSSGLNSGTLRAGDADPDAVAEALFASPFLAERKLVVLEGFLGAPAKEQERIAEMLGRKPESTVAIFFESDGADGLKKSPLYPLLAGQKFTEEFKTLAGTALERFIVEECAARDTVIRAAAARLLAQVGGDDTWSLALEIDKLCAHAAANGRKEITDPDVRSLVAAAREEPVFAFLDACSDGRCADAASLLERLLDAGTSELQVVSMLAKQYRTLIGARDLMDRGETDKFAVARSLGIHHFPAGKAMAAARRYRAEDLVARHKRLLEIERLFKTTSGRAKASLTAFVAETTVTR